MKISTAEIKVLLKECVKTEGNYTVLDFSEYVAKNSNKSFTKSQVSGAIAQLLDTGDIVRIERGLYRRKTGETKNNANIKTTKCKNNLFAQEAVQCLNKMEDMLADFANSKKIWQLNESEFEILAKMRELKESLEELRKKCEA